MMTTEELLEAMKDLPEAELEQLKQRLDDLLAQKNRQQPKRGDAIRSLAGAAKVGKVLDPLPDREAIYGEPAE